MRYAKVLAGEIVEILDIPGGAPAGSVVGEHPAKPYLLPVEDSRPEVDPVSGVEEGPVITIGKDKVTRAWTVRAKNSGEIDLLRAAARRRVEIEFQTRITAPITYIGHTWHADAEAVRRLMGVKLLTLGLDQQTTRSWTPYGSLTGVTVTYAQLEALGAAIAAREEGLFVKKKAKQAAIAALADAHEIADYDATAGWD